MGATSSPTSIGLETTRRRIARWRETRAYRGAPMPAALWSAAIALAQQHGLYATARALPVDYGALKKRVAAASTDPIVAPAFVELPPARPTGRRVRDRARRPAWSPPADRGERRDDGRPRDADAGGLARRAMIQLTPQMRIVVGVEPIDFRKGIDGLARACREVFQADPFSGWLFVFRNRRLTALRILVYDGQGFWLATKRLSRSKFRWWPASATAMTTLEAHQLQRLIMAGDPRALDAAPAWRRLATG